MKITKCIFKTLIFSVALLVVSGYCFSVAADDISCVVIADGGFKSVLKNITATANSTGDNKNWLTVTQEPLSGDSFSDCICVTSIGTTAPPGTNQIRFLADYPDMKAGECIYFSFYYRTLSPSQGNSRTFSPTFGVAPFNTNTGRVTDVSGEGYYTNTEYDKWQRKIYMISLTADHAAGNEYIQISWTRPSECLPEYCMEFAGFDVLYFANPGISNNALYYANIEKYLSQNGYYEDKVPQNEEYSKYGIELTGEFYKKPKLLYNSGKTGTGVVSESELRSWLANTLPEIRAAKILNGNYAFVNATDKFWNNNKKENSTLPALMDSTGRFKIDSQISESLFGWRSDDIYTYAEDIKQNTTYDIFTDIRGILIVGEDLSCIDTSLSDGTVNANYNSYDDIDCCLGNITWDDIHPTSQQYADYRDKLLNAMLCPRDKESIYSDFITAAINEANGYLAHIDYSDYALSPFDDISIPDISSSHAHQQTLESVYSRIKSMALGYRISVEANRNQSNIELLKKAVLYSMELMNDLYYSDNAYKIGGTPRFTTFKHTLPNSVADIIICMYDDMDASTRTKYVGEALAKGVIPESSNGEETLSSTYANALWATVPFIKLALIIEDDARINHAYRYLHRIFNYTKRGEEHPLSTDGFYEDGSFVFHNGLAYNMGYGKSYIITLGEYVSLSAGTIFDIKNVYGFDRVYDMIENAYLPFIMNYHKMKIVAGRETPESNARSILSSIILIASDAPDGKKEHLAQLIKPHITSYTKKQMTQYKYFDNFRSRTYPGIIDDLNKYFAYVDTVTAVEDYSYNKVYYNMDRVMHKRPDFVAGLAMSSERIGKYESSRDTYPESMTQWYIGDGMLYLYNDSTNCSSKWWANVNPYYMPGTTVDSTYRDPLMPTFSMGEDVWGKPDNDWAGGVSDGMIGVAGMKLGNKWVSGLRGTKSYFMFDNAIVCVGSGIAGGYGNAYTVVDNRLLSSGSESLYCDGTALANTQNTDITKTSPSWMFLDGANMGYIFDGSQNVTARRETSGASVYEIITVPHGSTPSNGGYAYTLLPNTTKDAASQYASSPEIEILSKTNDLHAVKRISDSSVLANIFTPQTFEGIEFADPCSVIINKNSDGGTIYLSDPTLKLTTITLEFDKPIAATGDCISVNGKTVTVDITEYYGKTYSFDFEYLHYLDVADIDELASFSKNVTAVNDSKNWLDVKKVDLADDYFDEAIRVTSTGVAQVPTSFSNQVRVFVNIPDVKAGDYIYFSFYYRVNSTDGTTQYTDAPPGFGITAFNKNSGIIADLKNVKYQPVGVFDQWRKVRYIAPLTADNSTGSMYFQFTWSKPAEMLVPYCIDITGIKVKYFGAMAPTDTKTVNEQILDEMSKYSFNNFCVNGTAVDMDKYPKAIYIPGDGTEINVDNYFINEKIIIKNIDTEQVQKTVITSASPDCDITDPADTRKQTYTVYTKAPPAIDNVIFTRTDDGMVRASFDYINQHSADCSFCVILAAYDSSGKMTVASYLNKTAESGTYVSLTEITTDFRNAERCKLMIWQSIEKPVALDRVYVYGNDS